ncbi:MAG: putative collagen-binding domain-containing protein, partial [Draconibacterium sp.]|nr:putative collagen-binding domain-containing protein [Draconibacterium sp.]
GFENLDGPSLQIGNPLRVHQRVKKWIEESEKAEKRWIVNLDEIGPAWKGAMPDSHDANHDTIRHSCLWGTLLAGGTGVEWYFGYRYPHNDLELEDFRSRAKWWKQSTIATSFVNKFPLEEMKSMDELINVKGAYCLAKEGEIYIVYLPIGFQNPQLKINTEKELSVKWLNPRDGGDLLEGSIETVSSGTQSLGIPPVEDGKDWVVLIQ